MHKHTDSLISSSLLGMFAARLHVLDALMDLRQQHSLQFSTHKQNKPTPDAAGWYSAVQSNEAHGYLLTGLWNSPGIKAGVGREQPRRSNKAAVK